MSNNHNTTMKTITIHKSFIKQQQELARGKADTTIPIYGGKTFYYSTEEDLDELVAQIITNTGAEIVRRVEWEIRDQEAPKPDDPHFTGCGGCGQQYPAICCCREVNETLDTIKQHITNITGVK